jgi:hypothetical protein
MSGKAHSERMQCNMRDTAAASHGKGMENSVHTAFSGLERER